MLTRLVRSIYVRRGLLKRLIPIRRPILLNLAGFKMYVRLDDWAVGARIAIKRQYESHVTAVMLPFLRPGSVLVDVGANIGYYTLLAAARVGGQGQVIAFEPGADNCALLKMSVEANRFRNVILHPYAVADIDGTVGFGLDDSNGQIAHNDPTGHPIQVRSVTLDSFLADEPRIDLIKMDIEGAEGLALQGMSNLIQRHRPVIFVEFTPHTLPRISRITPEAFLDRLATLGYALFVLPRGGNLSPAAQDKATIMAHFAGPHAPDHLDLLARPLHNRSSEQ